MCVLLLYGMRDDGYMQLCCEYFCSRMEWILYCGTYNMFVLCVWDICRIYMSLYTFCSFNIIKAVILLPTWWKLEPVWVGLTTVWNITYLVSKCIYRDQIWPLSYHKLFDLQRRSECKSDDICRGMKWISRVLSWMLRLSDVKGNPLSFLYLALLGLHPMKHFDLVWWESSFTFICRYKLSTRVTTQFLTLTQFMIIFSYKSFQWNLLISLQLQKLSRTPTQLLELRSKQKFLKVDII